MTPPSNKGNTMNEIAVGGGSFDLSPKSLEEAMKLAELLSDSTIVPKDYQGRPGNVLVAVQWGMEIGLKPMQAMQNIAVINGRPSLWGDAMLALVRSSPLCEYVYESDDGETATCRVKRVGEDEQVRTFGMEDAKTAGLTGKAGPWSQYPKRMRQMRARGFALRDVFPDVLKGMASAEEVRDTAAEKDVTPDGTTSEPQRTSSRADALRKKLGTGSTQKALPSQQFTAAMDAIALAACGADMQHAKLLASQITDEKEVALALSAYQSKVTELRARASTVDGETGQVVESLDNLVAEAARAASADDLDLIADRGRSLPDDEASVLADAIAERRSEME